jgi:nitrous-oxide reductase
MQLLYDMPLPLGEPHYAQMIKADKLKPIDVYKPGGRIRSRARPRPERGRAAGKERIERKADGVHVYMTAIRSHFTPDIIRVKEGDIVSCTSTTSSRPTTPRTGSRSTLTTSTSASSPAKHADVTFVADKAGVFPLYCTEFCSALHLEMAGYLLVEPK